MADQDGKEDDFTPKVLGYLEMDVIATEEMIDDIEERYKNDPEYKKSVDESVEMLSKLIQHEIKSIATQLATIGFASFFLDENQKIVMQDLTKLAIVGDSQEFDPSGENLH